MAHQRRAWPSRLWGSPAKLAHHPHVEKHVARRIGVPHPDQRPGRRLDADAEFFAQFARQSREAFLAGLELPAWELPAARQVLS